MDRLDQYLTQWAAWKRRPDIRSELGYPGHASPSLHRARIQSFDDLADELDGNAVQTVDALVCSLPEPEECSVYVFHLGSLWRFPSKPVETAYESARASLEHGLNEKGLP